MDMATGTRAMGTAIAGKLSSQGDAGKFGVRSLKSQRVCTLEFFGSESVPFWD
jgi:hypothetical protein